MKLSSDAADMPRLLLNAEPFGFGPSAAIATVFPHLRDQFNTVGYVGKHHTLDLQRGLPYDAIHDVSAMGKEERMGVLAPIFAQYDVFLSAMDHKMVEMAQAAGLKVFYYDALAWYWADIPQSVRGADAYIAQDFFGVGQRLSDIFGAATNAYIVPPIVSQPDIKTADERDVILINLGGLQNPFWPVEEIAAFADSVLDAIKTAVPQGGNIVIASSAAIADRLHHKHDIRVIARDDMQDVLARSRYAFMTPGLGNIYDAAAYNVPTIWLPPANDSQGQQLRLIEQHQMMDAALDWHRFNGRAPIDYKAEQQSVLKQVAMMAADLSASKDVQSSLASCIRDAAANVARQDHSKTATLISRFGTGGEQAIAQLVTQKSKGLNL